MIKHIIKKRILVGFTSLLLFLGILSFSSTGFIYAVTADSAERAAQSCTENGGEWDGQQGTCVNSEGTINTDCDAEVLDQSNCAIIGWLVIGINFLSALAGLAIVASMMIAGYEYMTAGDNSGQIQKARTRIVWALSALLLFIFMYALLNFLVPGGVL